MLSIIDIEGYYNIKDFVKSVEEQFINLDPKRSYRAKMRIYAPDNIQCAVTYNKTGKIPLIQKQISEIFAKMPDCNITAQCNFIIYGRIR